MIFGWGSKVSKASIVFFCDFDLNSSRKPSGMPFKERSYNPLINLFTFPILGSMKKQTIAREICPPKQCSIERVDLTYMNLYELT